MELAGSEFPAKFNDGVVGIKANKPIGHRKAFVKVPYKCIMSLNKVKEHEELKVVLKENPKLFSDEHCDDAEQRALFIFILYERQKGDESFWKPYLDVMPDVEFFSHWPFDVIIAT